MASSETEAEGELSLFATMPLEIRANIWKAFIPGGRVVDVIFSEDQDRYFSFGATVPTVLHVCQESRRVGLKAYTLCFGTESHPASIPFDLTADCLLFDNWLTASETKYENPRSQQWSCTGELIRLIGSMGQFELSNIHRIAFSSDLYTLDSHDTFTKGLKFLHHKFPALDFLVLVREQGRSPYSKGVIEFYDMEGRDYCCDSCYVEAQNGVYEAVKTLGMELRRSHSEGLRRWHPKINVRLRGVYRGGVKQPEKYAGQKRKTPNCLHGGDELLRVEHDEDTYSEGSEEDIKQKLKEAESGQLGVGGETWEEDSEESEDYDELLELEGEIEELYEEHSQYAIAFSNRGPKPGVDERAKIAAFIYGG